jgi:hypothetical protein
MVEMPKVYRTRLERIVDRDPRSHQVIVDDWNALATHMKAKATLSLRQFRRWLAGDVGDDGPRGASRVVSERFWGEPIEDLLAQPTAPVPRQQTELSPPPTAATDLRTIVMSAAHEASDHSARVATYVDPDSIETVNDRVIGLARRYATTSPLDMFGDLRSLRENTHQLLDRTGAPEQQKDLYLALSQVSALMAAVSFDLGVPEAAAEQARSAHTYGRLISHSSAQAFALAIRCTLAFWGGEPARGARLAAQGLELRSQGAAAVRLHAVSARCYALMNDPDATRDAIAAAEDARAGHDEMCDTLGGEFLFAPARAALCAGAAWLALEDGEAAAREARRSLDLYRDTPPEQRWYGGVHGARADLVAAQIYAEELDDATAQMQLLLDSPTDVRTSRLVQRARKLQALAGAPRFRGNGTARQLIGQAEAFVADASAVRALPGAPG